MSNRCTDVVCVCGGALGIHCLCTVYVDMYTRLFVTSRFYMLCCLGNGRAVVMPTGVWLIAGCTYEQQMHKRSVCVRMHLEYTVFLHFMLTLRLFVTSYLYMYVAWGMDVLWWCQLSYG